MARKSHGTGSNPEEKHEATKIGFRLENHMGLQTLKKNKRPENLGSGAKSVLLHQPWVPVHIGACFFLLTPCPRGSALRGVFLEDPHIPMTGFVATLVIDLSLSPLVIFFELILDFDIGHYSP